MLRGLSFEEMYYRVADAHRRKRDITGLTHQFQCISFGGERPMLQGVLEKPVTIGDTAQGQLADWSGIGRKYMNQMIAEAPGLAAANIGHWLQEHSQKKMLRCFDHGDTATLRAFLSDGYQRFDALDVINAVMPVFKSLPGLEFEASHLSPDSLYMKVFWPQNKREIGVGDVVFAGVVIEANETGLGATRITPMTKRLVCMNGMTHNDFGFRQIHTAQSPVLRDYAQYLSAETLRMTEESLVAQVRDVTAHFLRGQWLDVVVGQLQAAKGIEIGLKQAEELVEELPQKELIIDNFFRGGDASGFGLAQAVTATAHGEEVAALERSFEISTELEEAGGKLLSKLSPLRKLVLA